jgi:hypothetical protein
MFKIQNVKTDRVKCFDIRYLNLGFLIKLFAANPPVLPIPNCLSHDFKPHSPFCCRSDRWNMRKAMVQHQQLP